MLWREVAAILSNQNEKKEYRLNRTSKTGFKQTSTSTEKKVNKKR